MERVTLIQQRLLGGLLHRLNVVQQIVAHRFVATSTNTVALCRLEPSTSKTALINVTRVNGVQLSPMLRIEPKNTKRIGTELPLLLEPKRIVQSHYALGTPKPLLSTSTLHFSTSERKSSGKEITPRGDGRANRTQLQHIVDRLVITVPEFFNDRPDFSFYHHEMIFQNEIWGVTLRGVWAYWHALTFMRWQAAIRCSAIRMEIVSVQPDLENSLVHLRWRCVYLPLTQFYKLWGVRLGDREGIEKRLTEVGKWRDGYSQFHVDADGLVYKHILSSRMPDQRGPLLRGGLKALIAQFLGRQRALY